MSTTSFKRLIKDKVIQRADAMKVPLDAIFEEEGFNLRIEDDDFEKSIDELAAYIFAGGQVPPLEVRPTDAGVLLVDGHRRRRAFLKAREMGAPIDLIEVRAFTGNDLDRVARIMTSAEGRPLAPIETAMGYKRLAAFDMSPDEIAKKVGKTRTHVDGLLILANANRDVHRLVAKRKVSADMAIKAVRQHGENAGEYLRGQLEKATAAGKKKVTAGTINGKALPKKVVAEVIDSVDGFVEALPNDARQRLITMENAQRDGRLPEGQSVSVPAAALLHLLHVHASVREARNKQAGKAREKAAEAAQIDIEEMTE